MLGVYKSGLKGSEVKGYEGSLFIGSELRWLFWDVLGRVFSLSELLLRSIIMRSNIVKYALNASHRKRDWMAVWRPHPSNPKPSLTLFDFSKLRASSNSKCGV